MQSWISQYNLLTFNVIDSTNSEAIRLAERGVKDNYIILAYDQTSGRGQRQKEWYSYIGNFHATILVKSNKLRLNELPFLIGNILYDSITDLNLNCKIELKWVNDVLIEGKKLAGTLIETISYNDEYYVAIGIGVNLSEVPTSASYPTTSLHNNGININPEEFLSLLMENYYRKYLIWESENSFINTKIEWLKRAYAINKQIKINDGSREFEGIFRNISDNGAIIIELRNGNLEHIFSGSIVI